MLTRKIERDIAHWIQGDNRALLIDGARQVGKTYVIRKVLTDNGCEFIEFNLLQMPALVSVLERSQTIDDMVANLSLFADKPFQKGRTYIFFDEIQEFKELATKIKFWVDDGSFRFILSGSLLGVQLQSIRAAPVGYLKTLTLYPLDFEEFLQIYNFTDELRSSLHQSFIECTPVDDTVHARMMDIFHMYLNVGGMPSAVQTFADTKNLDDVISIHEDIILQYKRDFTCYESEDRKPYLTRIYELIPAQLNDANKRYNFSDLKKGFRYTSVANDFIWLANAGVALPVYNISQPALPLLLNEKSSLFKLFLSDVGMLTTMYGRATKMDILSENQYINHGAIYENVIAQELKAHGFKLYYYNSKKYGELDFVIEHHGRVLPIEVKSGKNYKRHSALCNVMDTRKYPIDEAYVLSHYNVETKGPVTYYPIYMMMFMQSDDIRFGKLGLDDLSM